MRKSRKPEPENPAWNSEVRLLAWLAMCVSVMAFLYYFRSGDVMLYGDAIAHINIARRVFDSQTPGLLQLGTVWLPLPHLLMIPFLISRRMWQSGAGGSIPSMTAYVFAVIGIFRLTRNALSPGYEPERHARIAAWVAAVIFAANPNLIYMQATAMGESLYLALFIWAVVYFVEFERGDKRALTKCGLCIAGACLTRYDAWFLAVVMAGVVLLQTILGSGQSSLARPSPKAATKFILIAAFTPIVWLAYNGIVYRNPLEFENGPYSAKAIERRTQNAGNPGHPGSRNLLLAAQYFVKSGEANVAQNQWLQRTWVGLLLAAIIFATFWKFVHKNGTNSAPYWLPLALLLIPLPFYALSIAYGGVPIFIPNWWPFTHYNVRYGLQLLPVFALAVAFVIYFVIRAEQRKGNLRLICTLVVLALVAASYATVWNASPICLEEARVNMRTRNQLQAQLANWIGKLPSDATLLMYLGDHVGALERAGFPLKQTINEGNHRVWEQPTDPEGLWERALADPSRYADYVLAFDGDPVWQAVHDRHLKALVEIHVTGQNAAILYRAR